MLTKTKLLTASTSDDVQIDDLVNNFISENKDINVKNISFQAVREGTVNGDTLTTHYAFVTYQVKDEKDSRKVGF